MILDEKKISRPRRKLIANLVFAGILFLSCPLVAADPWEEPPENIYWGDLHSHTNFSLDAFIMFYAPDRWTYEAGMYALHCAKLDFYAVTDHAETLTSGGYWDKAIETAQYFNRYASEHPKPDGDPAIVVFLGWEWTHHSPWGHKNLILKYDDPERLPPSPIRWYKGMLGFRPQDWFADRDQTFVAENPQRLFELVKKYCTEAGTGCEAVVIPHGNAWGQFTMHTDWDVQLNDRHNDPELQRIIEVYSKHGNSEDYRRFPPEFLYYLNGLRVSPSSCTEDNPCEKICQQPTESYEPCCFRAGEIVREKCLDPGTLFCKEQIELARQEIKPFPDGVPSEYLDQIKPEYRRNPGKVEYHEWRACGQCLDCYQPAFNYNPLGSVQKALASAYFDEHGIPHYYRFGFINSTDTHASRPGSVMEEKKHGELQHAHGSGFFYNASKATGIGAGGLNATSPMYGFERISNYLNNGGLAAILAKHRTRDDLWQALMDRHVYGTSGPRIEVWLRAETREKEKNRVVKMGDITSSSKNPVFHLKAKGTFREDGTCRYDEHPEIQAAMSREDFNFICYNQCYSPLEDRVPLARIEVIKIRQPLTNAEAGMQDLKWSPENPNGLIMDPYVVFEFHDAELSWTWTDDKFEDEKPGRSIAYYFRVIQEPTPGYNCRPTERLSRGQTCDNRVPLSDHVAEKANPQDGSTPHPRDQLGDLCYSDAGDTDTYCEERAWTSPVYIVRE